MIIYFAELYPSFDIHKALLRVSSIVLKDKLISIHHLLKVKASKKKNVKWISFIFKLSLSWSKFSSKNAIENEHPGVYSWGRGGFKWDAQAMRA